MTRKQAPRSVLSRRDDRTRLAEIVERSLRDTVLWDEVTDITGRFG